MMRNARTLIERMTLSKAIDGELHTVDVDLHEIDGVFYVYVYDPNEEFESDPFTHDNLDDARQMFERCVSLIIEEPVYPAESAYDFAERIYDMLADPA